MRTLRLRMCRLDLAHLGRPVHLGSYPNRLRPGTSLQALQIPSCDDHLMDTLPSEVQQAVGFRVGLAVPSFRLRARLDLSIPSAFSGQRGLRTPLLRYGAPHLSARRDFNPPEQRAAQHALPIADHLSGTVGSLE